MNENARCASCGHKRNVHAGRDCLATRCGCGEFVPTFTLEEVQRAYKVSANLGHPPDGWWKAFLAELEGASHG